MRFGEYCDDETPFNGNIAGDTLLKIAHRLNSDENTEIFHRNSMIF